MGAQQARDVIWLVVVGAGLLLVVALLTLRSVSLGPGRATSGEVIGLVSAETDVGTLPRVMVRVDGGDARVALRRGDLCAVGDEIALVEQRTLFGRRYAVGPGGCQRR